MISLMYTTCYTYKSLWEPFLKLKNKYIDNTIPTYFCTDEIKDYKLNDNNIKVLTYGHKSNFGVNGNYYKRMLYYLHNIDTDYILYFYDDMFPLAKVDMNKLNAFVDIMNTNDNIKIIKLSTHSFPCYNGTLVNYNGIDFMKANNALDSYIMNVQPILIKKDFFIDVIYYCMFNNTIHQNGGMEIYGTEYFKNNDEFICLRIIDDIIVVNDNGGIVRSGVITDETKNMLKEKEDIDIQTYENNMIFKLTQDEYDNLGNQLKEVYANLNIQIKPE